MVWCDFVALAVFHRRFRQREHRARGVPPHLSPRLGGSKKVTTALASDTVAGGGVRMCLGVSEIIFWKPQAVAQGARVWIQAVGTRCLGSFTGIQKLRRGRVCQGAPSPLTVLVGLWTLWIESWKLLDGNKKITVIGVGDLNVLPYRWG